MVEVRQIHPLTGLRGLASLWVLLHHAPNLYPLGAHPPVAPIRHLLEKGWMGVDVFFVLSGFVISHVYASSMARFSWPSALRFWRLRLARIYPAHLVATVAFVPVVAGARLVLGEGAPKGTFDLDRLVYALTLTNGWGIPDSAGWNLPSWSVSSEWFAYLLFPVCAGPLGRVRGVWANLAVSSALLGVMIGAAHVITGGTQFILPEHLTLTRIASEFVIGCLLWNAYRDAGSSEVRGADTAAGLCLALIVVLAASGASAVWDWVFIAASGGLVLGLARARGPVARALSGRVAVFLGEISYSVYLIHTVILLVMGELLQRVIPDPALAGSTTLACVGLAFVAASLSAGYALFRCVEEPARRQLRPRR